MANHILSASKKLQKYYKAACFAEIEALKPGNVHMFADGHGMQVQDFIKSAEASSAVISQLSLPLGERIYQSVGATRQAVGCNTNLGIILLCAPLIQCFLQPSEEALQVQLKQLLNTTTKADAEWVFKAILIANPAGLGNSGEHDVNNDVTCTLLEAMQYASEKDFIALQYSNGFSTILNEGLPRYQQALSRLERPAWAVTELYLYWLSHYLDSHILRKYGESTAQAIKAEASTHYEAFMNTKVANQYLPALLAFDQSLKSRAINPGTTADLTVSTVFLQHCVNKGNF